MDSAYNVLLSTDKPVYQPGQTIHIRALALDTLAYDHIGADPSELVLSKEGDRTTQYQVSTEYYQPWPGPASTPSTPRASQGVRINVGFDRTQLAVDDVVQVNAQVELLSAGVAGTLLVDLGIPPGYTPLTDDLNDLVV